MNAKIERWKEIKEYLVDFLDGYNMFNFFEYGNKRFSKEEIEDGINNFVFPSILDEIEFALNIRKEDLSDFELNYIKKFIIEYEVNQIGK